MSSPTISLLAGLVGGVNKAQEESAHQELASRAQSREAMMTYLGQMASNQNIPPEHQQWALGKLQELTQADVTKKLPKVDLGELPAVSVRQPPRQAVTQTPGVTLQQPTPPGGAGGPSAPQTPASGQSGVVGRDSGGKVNALGGAGQIQLPEPPLPAGLERPRLVPSLGNGQLTASGVQSPSANIPPGPPTIVQNPQPPIQIAPGGGPHVLTASDRLTMANAAQQEEMNLLQQRFPDKTPEQLAYFAKHDEFPKPEAYTLGPGQERFEGGKLVAENKETKPGSKSGFTYDKGLVKNNATGAMLTDQEIAANPEAKAVFETGEEETKKQEARQDLRDSRKSAEADRRQQRAFANSTDQKVQADAIKAAATARPMVNILNTQTDYVKSGKYTPRQDLSLVVGAVRAMNPGTVRLPNTELELELRAGSYGDRFKRWADNATTGTLPDDQRQDLLTVIKGETDKTAGEAANNWQQAFGDKKPLPTHLTRYGVREPQKPSSSSGGFNWDDNPTVSGAPK